MNKEKIWNCLNTSAKAVFLGVLLYGAIEGLSVKGASRNSRKKLEQLSLDNLQPATSAAIPRLEDIGLGILKPSTCHVNSIPLPEQSKPVQLGPNEDYSFLMEDREFTNSTYLTAEEIQNYLERHDSALARKTKGEYFSNLVCRLAQKEVLNPLLLVARAQTEKSALGKTELTKKEKRELMGADVTDNGRRRNGEFGFKNQIEACARKLRQYYDSWTNGSRIIVDYGDHVIIPTNAATDSLLHYTPHTTDRDLSYLDGGNKLFMEVYSRMRKDFEEQKAERRMERVRLSSSKK